VIIDAFDPADGEGKHIYVRYRNDDGEVMERIVDDFRPYFFVENLNTERLSALYDDNFDGWGTGGLAEAKDGRELLQIYAPMPEDVKRMRNMAEETWEADMHFPDRFAIDTFTEPSGEQPMPDWFSNTVRAGGFDMEWNEDGAITAMGYTTDGEQVHQWSWHPNAWNELITMDAKGIESNMYSSYFTNEKEMLEDFANAFNLLDPDVITTWSGNRADWPKLYERFKHHDLSMDWISPIASVSHSPPMKHLPRSGYYEDGTQVILGRMTIDLADRNHGFERVWKDSGKGQLGDRRLGSVLKEAFPNNPEWHKIDFENDPELLDEEGNCIVDGHHDLWLNHFDKFIDYHRQDIIGTDRLDREYHVTRFFMALQQVCGVSFSSVFTVSRFARGLLRRRAWWKAPTGNKKQKHESYGGGYIPNAVGGRHDMVAVFDFRAHYAAIQEGHNISPETLRGKDGECWVPMTDNILALENGTFWEQSEIGVLPELQIDLADARNAAKQEMKNHDPKSSEYAGFNTLQLAFKRAAASVYGLMGHTGHGESDLTVASTITYVGRELLKRLMEICEEMGYTPLAAHTDSAYIAIGDADGHEIAERLTQTIQDEWNTDKFIVEFEKLMLHWVAHDEVKNRNFGWVIWPKEGLHCTGFELKKSNAAEITKRIQETAFISMCKEGASEDDIRELVNSWIASVRTTVKREALVMRSRLGKKPEAYGNKGGFQGAAKRYNDTNPREPFVIRDGVPHVYSTKGIEAFRTSEELEKINLDYTTIIQKQIIAPVSLIFEAMGWKEPNADGAVPQDWWN